MHEQFISILLRYENLITMAAAGAIVETLKRAFPRVHGKDALRRVKPLFPLVWCSVAMVGPFGLAPPEAALGERVMLGCLLGGMTSWAYEQFKRLAPRFNKNDNNEVPK